MRPLNFASQPFRNERLPALLFGVAAAALVALTIQHALVIRGLLPARTSKLHREVADLEAELDRLRSEARSLPAPNPDKQVIAEWSVLKDLVDRRTFSWTGLFARLERVLPRNVRLISIAPDVKGGQVVLEIVALARPSQAGLGLVGLFEQREEFEDVYPMRVNEREGGAAEFDYTMRYLPEAAAEASAAGEASAEGEASASPDASRPPGSDEPSEANPPPVPAKQDLAARQDSAKRDAGAKQGSATKPSPSPYPMARPNPRKSDAASDAKPAPQSAPAKPRDN